METGLESFTMQLTKLLYRKVLLWVPQADTFAGNPGWAGLLACYSKQGNQPEVGVSRTLICAQTLLPSAARL